MAVNYEDAMMHKQEPYAYQRSRNAIHANYPRMAQPNTSQPNQKTGLIGWGANTSEYYSGIFNSYLKRRG